MVIFYGRWNDRISEDDVVANLNKLNSILAELGEQAVELNIPGNVNWPQHEKTPAP